MANDVKPINLLPDKGDSLLTQFLSWGLTVGRLLVILTETVALGTFLYRFNLDMKIVDLHDQIKSESFIVQNFAKSEANFRNIQTRLALAKQYDTKNNTPLIFKDIAEMGRGRITFQNLLVSSDTVKIEAQASSANALSLFVQALKKYPNVTSVSIDKVENKTSNAKITIAITAELKQ